MIGYMQIMTETVFRLWEFGASAGGLETLT